MLRLIAADLRRNAPGALALMLIVALATALGVAVTLQERALRLGSARAAAAFPVVIGAPGSETQLVLSTVFLQAAPLGLIPATVLDDLAADPHVAWAAPVGFGDFVEDYPIVGTTPTLLQALGTLREGRAFAPGDEEGASEAVIGAAVPLRLGDRFHPLHGRASAGGHPHAALTYAVTGRMAPTGTAWDRAVLVPIEAVWHAHGMEAAESGATPAGTDPPPRGVPAVLVKPRSIADAYKLRQSYRTDHSLAVFPAEVLTRLYGTLGDARFVLAVVAAGAQALVAAALLLVILLHVGQRRRQIGALRAFGAPRLSICAVVWSETMLLLGGGLLAGIGLGYGAALALSARLEAMIGFPLPVLFSVDDAGPLALLLAATALMAVVPALLAYRQSPAQALRG